MDKIYFAKSKNIGGFHVGTGNKIGFKSIGALKTSIILKDKKFEQYELYY
ncbi:hypothetical protein GSQ49_19835, partial [Clostridioides difficile]|nr:hypothetical protein [Clostridioides difficile]